MSTISEDKNSQLPNERKIRFRPTKVLFHDNKINELFKNEKIVMSTEETEPSKKDSSTSLLSFLHVELTRGYVLEHDEERYSARREKVYSFMKIPREVEKFMSYGFKQCTDSFLFVYTFLPMRFVLALWTVLCQLFAKCFALRRRKYILAPAQKCDLLKATLVIVSSVILSFLDTNMMYHVIKSQSVIKLYIFFNMLEVADRLFSAFGQDTIDALLWTATEPKGRKREHLGLIPHLLFAALYVLLHSFLVLCQATTLNVAINSNNKALLTIMMSNNFVELKGSVFKKFDKNNLFQVSCSDVRERFHLFVLLFVVSLQTMKEYSWKTERLWVLLPDCFLVYFAELFVDWIKHAFITRFNELQMDVYKDYTISLAYDMAQTRQKHAFSDHSDLVARRMGFIPLPLAVVTFRVLAHSVYIVDLPSIIIAVTAYFCLVAYRVKNSIVILAKASDLIAQHRQERASAQSPSTNRAGSPVLITKLGISRDLLKDIATSPLKPTIDQPAIYKTPISVNGTTKEESKLLGPESDPDYPLDCSLESTAIFSNSTVDLKNVSLNEELLKVEGDEIQIETAQDEVDILTRSEPNINSEFTEESTDLLDGEVTESGLKKRAESEPSLIKCNTEAEDMNK